MKGRIHLLFSFIFVLLITIAPIATHAAVTGNTYNFVVHWLEQTYQENDSPIVNADTSGEFSVHVWNISQRGSDDLLFYNYQGWAYYITPTYVNVNDSVAFQENKVYWELYSTDSDNDNRSESVFVSIRPSYVYAHPGNFLFVNPIWSTHDSYWNQAVDDTKNVSSVDLSTFSHSASDGQFTFSFTVNTEYTRLAVNGTVSFTFSAIYDSDGVLESLRFSIHHVYASENYTLDYVERMSIYRTNVIGESPILNLDTGVPVMYLAAIIPASVIVGILIGKKVFG